MNYSDDLNEIYGKVYKNPYSIQLKQLCAYPNIESAAEAYAVWHDGNFPKEMLINNFIKAANQKFNNISDLKRKAEEHADWHDGNFPKEMLINDFIIANLYSKNKK